MTTNALFLFILGAIMGSFLAAMAHRMPKEMNLWSRSQCDNCEKKLSPFDLMPILSWILNYGKCRYCKNRIPAQYLFSEIAMGGLFAVSYEYLSHDEIFFIFLLQISIAYTMILIDIENCFMPTFLILLFAISTLLQNYDIDSIIAGCVYFACGLTLKYIFLFVKKKDGLGIGDVYLLFPIGLMCKFHNIDLFLMSSGTIGLITALIWKKRKKSDIFPFAHALLIPGLMINFSYLI